MFNNKEYFKKQPYTALDTWFPNFESSLRKTAMGVLGVDPTNYLFQDQLKNLIAFVQDSIQESYEEELVKRLE